MQCLRTARRTPCPISPGAKPSEEEEDDSEEEHTPRGHGLVGADRAQHYLFLGWRNDVADMVAYLDEIAPHGSTLTIAAQLPLDERELQMNADGRHRRDGLQNLTLTHIVESVVSRHALEMLPLLACDAILILSDHGQSGDPTHADSLALAALMLTRDIQRRWCHDPTTTLPPLAEGIPLELASDRRPRLDDANPTSAGGASPSHWHTLRQSHRSGRRRRASRELNSECTVVTELRDISLQRNVRASGLAEGDFVASNELVARIVAMISERAEACPPDAAPTPRQPRPAAAVIVAAIALNPLRRSPLRFLSAAGR